jgi:hypothetical protein
MRPGRSRSPWYGTSFATGTPERAITISSPAPTRVRSWDKIDRASYVLYAASLSGLFGLFGLIGLFGLT